MVPVAAVTVTVPIPGVPPAAVAERVRTVFPPMSSMARGCAEIDSVGVETGAEHALTIKANEAVKERTAPV